MTITVDGGLAGPLAFAPEGLILAGGCVDRVVRIWDSIKGIEQAKLSGHPGPVTGLAFSPNANTLATVGGGRVKLWDTEFWHETSVLRAASEENPTALLFSTDSGTLVAGNHSGAISLWDVPDRRESQWSGGHQKDLRRTVYSPEGKLLAAGQPDGSIRLWDSAGGAPLRSLTGHTLRRQRSRVRARRQDARLGV